MRDYEEHFSEVICPEGSESPSQRLLFNLNSPVSHCSNRKECRQHPTKILEHPGVSGELKSVGHKLKGLGQKFLLRALRGPGTRMRTSRFLQ